MRFDKFIKNTILSRGVSSFLKLGGGAIVPPPLLTPLFSSDFVNFQIAENNSTF